MPQKRITLYQSLVPPPRQPDIRVFDQAIFQRWTEPPKPKIAGRMAVALIASGLFAPVLNPNTQITQNYESRWHQGWSEPVRQKPGLRPYLQDTGAPDVALPQPPVSSTSWFVAWSEPARFRRYGAHLQDVGAPDVVLPPPVLSSQWHGPWSEPTRKQSRIYLNEDLFETITVTTGAIAPATFSSDVIFPRSFIYQSQTTSLFPPPVLSSQWYYPWSEPVRLKKFSPALQSVTALPVTTPVAAAVTIVDTSDYGVIFPRSFIYQSQTKPVFPPTPETITADKWIYPWSEPVRTRRFPTSEQQVSSLGFPPPVTAGQWIYAWSEPVRSKRGLSVTLQQTLAWQFVAPVAPSTDVVVPTTWSGPPDRNLLLQYQRSTAPVTVPSAEIITVDKWFKSWQEPVRIRRGLRASEQQAYTAAPYFPNFIRTINWYQPYSEPVRQKKGLWAWLQQFFDTDHKPISSPVTLVMNATEVNSDTAIFAINVFTQPPVPPAPFSVRVSITEVQSGTNPWSIEEV